MTNGTDDLKRVSNSLTQLNYFLLQDINLNGRLYHKNIDRFQKNKVSIIINALSMSSLAIFHKNVEDER